MQKLIAVLMLLVATTVSTVFADNVTVTWGSAPSGYTGTVNVKNTVINATSLSYSKNVTLPPYTATISDPSNPSLNGLRNVYCVDLMSGVDTGTTQYILSSMGGQDPITLSLKKTDGSTTNVNIGGDRLRAIKYLLSTDANNSSMYTKASMSVALWELVYQTGTGSGGALAPGDINAGSYPSSSTGGFKLTNSSSSTLVANATTLAGNAYLFALQNPTYDASNVYLLTSCDYQDFAFAIGGGAGVPEPTLLVSLASLGLIGLPFGIGAYRRRLA
jgi:hypothetical protein